MSLFGTISAIGKAPDASASADPALQAAQDNTSSQPWAPSSQPAFQLCTGTFGMRNCAVYPS